MGGGLESRTLHTFAMEKEQRVLCVLFVNLLFLFTFLSDVRSSPLSF